MRTRDEIELELRKVRRLLKARRDGSLDDSMLYGAQQALGWMLGELRSPSELERTIQRVARKIFAND